MSDQYPFGGFASERWTVTEALGCFYEDCDYVFPVEFCYRFKPKVSRRLTEESIDRIISHHLINEHLDPTLRDIEGL